VEKTLYRPTPVSASAPKALAIYAGPVARDLLQREGLQARHVAAIPAAAGGPKGLMLTRLDQFLFGEWLPQADQAIDLIGASIGAWRMATACMPDSMAGFQRLESDYVRQRYDIPPGKRMPSSSSVSEAFARSLHAFYDGHVDEVLAHPRYRLHIMTSHGLHMLNKQGSLRTPLGYACAFFANAVSRKALGSCIERVVFTASEPGHVVPSLPFAHNDLSTRQYRLDANNFFQALQASCSIPFALDAVHNIPGGPTGAYWDGGITDYHLHLHYKTAPNKVVLYPHFQRAVVPGWLDKTLKHRHGATSALDSMVVIAPRPEWVRTLPSGKLPDRHDFMTYKDDFAGRVKVWQQAVDESQRLVDELSMWLDNPDMNVVQSL
jgi:hypothetical protein